MEKLVSVLLVCSAIASAQTPQIRTGSTVYIEPMGGYETFLSAAIIKKHVPLAVVMNKDKADYIIASSVAHKDLNNQGSSVTVNTRVNNTPQQDNQIAQSMQQREAERAAERRSLGETSASISVIDVHTSQIVFAHSSGKMGTNQLQNSAEDCAKHLKEFIEKSEKSKK